MVLGILWVFVKREGVPAFVGALNGIEMLEQLWVVKIYLKGVFGFSVSLYATS
jgi:hypothetical protein